MKISLIVPTLNEIEGMKAIMPRIKREWYDQIILLDGGSGDGTIEYAKERGYQIHIQKKPGLRNAYTEILDQITGDILITFSPDGNSVPELIPELISKMKEGYDMVIVSRYLGKAKSLDDDLVTAFGNWLFTKTINVLHGGHYTDSLVIFRAYKKSMIFDLELTDEKAYAVPEKLLKTHASWEPLLSVRAARRKLAVTEISGDEPPRIGGERKVRIFKWGAVYYYQFIRDFLIRW